MKYIIIVLFFIQAQANIIIEIKDNDGNKTIITKEVVEKENKISKEIIKLLNENKQLKDQIIDLKIEINQLKKENMMLEKSLLLGNALKEIKTEKGKQKEYIFNTNPDQKEQQARQASGQIAKIGIISGILIAILIISTMFINFFRKRAKHELAD